MATDTLDRERVQRILSDVHDGIDGAYAEDLMHRLETEDGLKFSVSKGYATAKMQGIAGAGIPTENKAKSLSVAERCAAVSCWANAARRTLRGRG